jgi:hypothetical protein
MATLGSLAGRAALWIGLVILVWALLDRIQLAAEIPPVTPW